MNPTWRKRLRTSWRVAGATVLLFLVAELVLRLFGYGNYILYTADDDLLWRPLPNQHGVTVAGRQPITINGEGFRYTTGLSAVDPNEFRIYAFGDSVTMGWGVDDDSHYSAVLERLLARDAPPSRRYRVVSAGVNAYPIALCERRFEKMLAAGTQVDLAILAYSFNESFASLTKLQGAEREAFLRKVRIKGLVRRSALYNFLIEDLLRQAVYYRIRTRLMEGSWSEHYPEGEELANELKAYRGELEAMRAASARRDVRLVFLLVGSKGQRSHLGEFQAAFLDFAHQHEIPVLDMVALLTADDHAPLFMDHTHPSVLGHQRIAEALLDLLRSRHLLGDAGGGDAPGATDEASAEVRR